MSGPQNVSKAPKPMPGGKVYAGKGTVKGDKVTLSDGSSYSCNQYTLGWGLDNECLPQAVHSIRQPGKGSYQQLKRSIWRNVSIFFTTAEPNAGGRTLESR